MIDLADKIVSDLKKYSLIDLEDVQYYPEKFAFKEKEFRKFIKVLDKLGSPHETNFDSYFPEYKSYFHYKGIRFTWRLLLGQGSAYQLYINEKDYNRDKEINLGDGQIGKAPDSESED